MRSDYITGSAFLFVAAHGLWGDIVSSSRKKTFTTIVLMGLLAGIPAYAIADITGRVVDSVTGEPIPGAIVTSNSYVTQTDEHGIFSFKTEGDRLKARAYGYMGAEAASSSPEIKLIPFRPKAVYLSFFGIGDRTLRESALKLIEETELNALVIDVKGDRGLIPYKRPSV